MAGLRVSKQRATPVRRQPKTRNRAVLATYLGIHHRGRFRRRRAGVRSPKEYRRRLLLLALILLALGLWGVWLELGAGG